MIDPNHQKVIQRYLLKNHTVVQVSEETKSTISGWIEGENYSVFIPKTYIEKQLQDYKAP